VDGAAEEASASEYVSSPTRRSIRRSVTYFSVLSCSAAVFSTMQLDERRCSVDACS